jgi:hypothetical protein
LFTAFWLKGLSQYIFLLLLHVINHKFSHPQHQYQYQDRKPAISMHATKLSASGFADLASQLTDKTFEVPIILIWTKRVKDPNAIKIDPLAHPLHTPANLNLYPKWRKVSSISVECKTINTLKVFPSTPLPS